MKIVAARSHISSHKIRLWLEFAPGPARGAHTHSPPQQLLAGI